MENSDMEPKRVILPVELVHRQSTAPAPADGTWEIAVKKRNGRRKQAETPNDEMVHPEPQ
jgi:hypothetical protein